MLHADKFQNVFRSEERGVYAASVSGVTEACRLSRSLDACGVKRRKRRAPNAPNCLLELPPELCLTERVISLCI